MGRTTAECVRIEKSSGNTAPGALSGCSVQGAHKGVIPTLAPDMWSGGGRESITVINESWGVPGLGTDGTLAMGGMAIAAAAVTIIAWRALTPTKPVRR